jgi:uncharacterized SAM-binding protein YcdF (DUF218 family)
MLAAAFLAWVGATLYLFVLPPTDAPGQADAVVVLSGGRDSRLEPAVRLVERKVAPVLVISGAGYDPEWQTARHLCAGGASGYRVVCFDPHPYSTHGEAEAIARLARANGWTRLDVVTSRYHVFRAGMLVRRCYHDHLAMIGTPSPFLTTLSAIFTEWAKLVYQLTIQRSC